MVPSLRAWCAIALAAALCPWLPALGGATASAAPAWLAPVELPAGIPGDSQSAGDSSVASDADGDSFAVWQRVDGPVLSVQAAVRPAGGVWQAPVEISTPGTNPFDPVLSVDSEGDAVVAWTAEPGFASGDDTQAVDVALRPAGGAWQVPVAVSAPGEPGSGPTLASDSGGGAAVVWYVATPTGSMLESSVRPAASGVWGPAEAVAPPVLGTDPALAGLSVDPSGNVLALWNLAHADRTPDIVQSAELPAATGGWQAPVDLTIPGDAADADSGLAVDPAGDALALLEDTTTLTLDAVIRPAATGLWQAPVVLSAPGQDAVEGSVGLDPQGNAIAAWAVFDASHDSVVQSASRPVATGVWTTPVDISPSDVGATEPALAVGPTGDAVALWQAQGPNNGAVVAAAVRPATLGAWQAPVQIGSSTGGVERPRVALDGQGDAVAVWDDSGADTVYAAGYDAAGPLLDGLAIPATGTVGVPVSFAATPLDVWSPLGATSWTFGDGAGAGGAQVAHTYAVPGTYAVSLTSADALGNTTTATGQISIGAATSALSTAPPPASPNAPAPAPVASPVAGPPILTQVRQSRSRWLESGSTARGGKIGRPVGTTFSLHLDRPALLRLTFTLRTDGRVVDHRCVPASAANHAKPSCSRGSRRGAVSLAAHAGTNRVSFDGRVAGGRLLKAGVYTVAIVATAAHGRSSASRQLTFTIAASG